MLLTLSLIRINQSLTRRISQEKVLTDPQSRITVLNHLARHKNLNEILKKW